MLVVFQYFPRDERRFWETKVDADWQFNVYDFERTQSLWVAPLPSDSR